MNILVIKQTSLGDVLHSTAALRAIRAAFPAARIVLLTSTTAHDIYRYNPRLDQIIAFDRYRVKRGWYREPLWCLRHASDVLRQVRARRYDLAIDLQGRWKSVLFLYGARAGRKIVKGRWWGLEGVRRRELHALAEMDLVLALAGIESNGTGMEIFNSTAQTARIDALLDDINPARRAMIVLSPFTRWPAKNWPASRYAELARRLPDGALAVFAGAGGDRAAIASLLAEQALSDAVNVAGRLSLLEFAELVKRARAVVTGDSFPMHLACAAGTPVIALFGPTDERRVGPLGDCATVLRTADCQRCYQRRHCARACLARISVDQVRAALACAVSISPQISPGA